MTGVSALAAISSGEAPQNKFCSLYPNRVQAILRPLGCKNWTTISKHWPLPDETILAAVAGTEPSIYGLRWSHHTRFAVLDVDAGSKYHDAQELKKLVDILAGVSLRATVYQSSESGGWHVYLFLAQWETSNEVQETLRAWLTANGYEIRGGQLEIFPSGNGLRLPLQPGFAWLDDTGTVLDRRENLTSDEAISRFLDDLEGKPNNWPEIKMHIESRLEQFDRQRRENAQAHEEAVRNEGFDELFNYRLIRENYEKGRQYWKDGLTQTGQRHDAILCVEHYLWHGDSSAAGVPALPGEWNDETRYRLISAWIEAKHNGFCNHINRAKWQKVDAQIRRAVKWRRPSGAVQVRTPYPLTERSIERLIALSKSTGRTWSMDDLKKGNDGREEEARKKIREAVHLLTAQARRVTLRQLMRLTGCCNKTIKRHLDIWSISPVVSLPSVGGDKNPVLDLIAPCPLVLVANGSGSEKKVLDVLVSADSGDLDSVQDSGSEELAPIVLTPPFLLPGSKPAIEPPASRPSPAGAFGSLDAGAPVLWHSGRTADGAGGLEPEQKAAGTALFLAWSRQRHAAISSERSAAVTGRRESRNLGAVSLPFGKARYRAQARAHEKRYCAENTAGTGLGLWWHRPGTTPESLVERREIQRHAAVRQDKGRTAVTAQGKHHGSFDALPPACPGRERHCRSRNDSSCLGLSTLPRAPPDRRPEPRFLAPPKRD